MDKLTPYIFLLLSSFPGLCMILIPWLVFRHKRTKYSLPVQAKVMKKHIFTWFDAEYSTRSGMQLIYQYELNGVLYTWRGRPIHRIKDISKGRFVTLYVNPADETDVWENGKKFDLYISTFIGIVFIIGGCAATILYFGLL